MKWTVVFDEIVVAWLELMVVVSFGATFQIPMKSSLKPWKNSDRYEGLHSAHTFMGKYTAVNRSRVSSRMYQDDVVNREACTKEPMPQPMSV